MADLGTLRVNIDANTAGLQQGIARAQASVARAGARMKAVGAGMTSVGKTMSLAVTAPLLIMGKMGVEELGEIQAANAQTEAAIKRLGGGVKLTTKDIQDQAGALQKLSGMDDQAIQSAQNMLLTQGNLQVKTAAGVRTFKQASRVMVDFAAATKKEPTAAAKALGMALADPVNNLKRMGKQAGLTKDEMAALKKRMEGTSSQSKRQAMLLDVLGAKFKGAGAAAGSTLAAKMAVVKDQLAGVAATIVSYAIPYVERFANWMQSLMAKFEALSPKTKKWIALAVGIGAVLGPVLVIVGSLVGAIGTIVTALAAVGGPVIAVIAVIAALAAAFVILYRRNEGFRQGVHKLAAYLKKTFVPVVAQIKATLMQWAAWLKAFWNAHGAQIIASLKATWRLVAPIIKAYLQTAANIIKTIMAVLRGDWRGAWNSVKATLSSVWAGIKAVLRLNAAALGAIMRGYKAVYTAAMRAAWSGIKAATRAAWNGMVGLVSNLASQVVGAAASGLSGLAGAFTRAGAAAKNALVSAIKSIPGAIRSIHIPLPSVSVGMKSGPKGIKIPSFSVKWAARGAIVNGAQIMGVGEAGPEAIVPLGRGSRASADRARIMRQAGLAGGGGITIHNLTVNANDRNGGRVAARAFLDELQRQAPAATFAGAKIRMG